MKDLKRHCLRSLSPVCLLLPLLICAIYSGNIRAINPASSSALPAGFEDFDEYRVFGHYGDKINGYDVKVMILPAHRTWRGTCRAILNFSNEEGTYKIVDDGWMDDICYDEDEEVRLMPDNSVIDLSYNPPLVPKREAFTMDIFANLPFVFYDIDFDGKKELIINLAHQGQRWKNAYEVVQMEPDRLYSIYRKPPFTDLDDMTIIDPVNKTITINLYEGHGEEWHTVYSIREDDSSLFPIVTKEYTDDMCFGGIDDDTRPMYRRIYTREQNDTTGWMPIK